MTQLSRWWLIAGAVLVCLIAGLSLSRRQKTPPAAVESGGPAQGPINEGGGEQPTLLYAHNVRLRHGPQFRVSIRWIRGEMLRRQPAVAPSLDDPESFVMNIDKGVVRISLADVNTFLNSSAMKDAPLKRVSITADGDTVTLKGTVHKIVSLPVALIGRLTPLPDGRVLFRVAKIDVLKVPMKGLLGGLHLQLKDLVHAGLPGFQISGNDVIFDGEKLLPPPHIRGQISSIKIVGPEIEIVYGGAGNDEAKLSQWHNFLKLTGGTLGFGKLTMHDTDLTMIDATQKDWFDLDLVHYQAQLVNGTVRVTRQAGLEIFMPGADAKASDTISMDWLKHRSEALPSDIQVQR